jgi:cell division protein FtsA
MAQKEEIYVGLDIGSSKITCVVGKKEAEDRLAVIGIGTSQMTGIKKGVVVEIEETVSGISEAIEVAERMAGVDIVSASVNVNGSSIGSLNSTGVVAVSRADKQIIKEDVIRAEEASQAVQISPNKEIRHIIPRMFKVDDQEGIKDPVGMSGIRLEVETHLITVGVQPTKNLRQVASFAGIKIDDEIVSPLAAAKAVAQKKQMDLGCAVVDIGAATTGVIVYEDGEVFYTDVLPIGGMHITNDIAIGLRTSIDVAEKVKVKYGHSYKKGVSEKDEVDLSEIDIKEEGKVTKRHIAEIVEARVEEILGMVREKLKNIEKDALLPAGVILTGGVARMPGLEEKAKEVLKLPVQMGTPHHLFGMTEKIYDPMYSTVIGLMLYNFEEANAVGSAGRGSGALGGATGVIKKIFKTFLP